MAANGIGLLRISIGIIFFWFGFIKYFPGLSSIEDLALSTTRVLTFDMFSDNAMAKGLATFECLIGIGLVTGKFLRANIISSFITVNWSNISGFYIYLRSI